MKRILSLILSICVVIAGLPMTVYAASNTPEISLEEFSAQLNALTEEYDSEYIPEITVEDGSEFCHVGGEAVPLSVENEETATVTKDNFEIPTDGLKEYEILPEEESRISTFSVNDIPSNTLDKESAEDMGFEVDIDDDTVTLSKPYQTQRLIVKSKYDIDPLDSVAVVEGYNDLHIVQFDNEESAKAAQEYYKNQNRIEYAEPDLVVSAAEYDEVETTAADDDMGINYGNHLSWGSEAIGVDDYIDYLPSVDELPEIVVGILDSGIDYDHEFLKNRVIRSNYNISSSGNENDEKDDDGHGSHVAGIVVDNTTSNVKVKGYKVLDSEGYGTISKVALALEYAITDGVNVINMSLGVKGESKEMEEAVNSATDAGIVVCVSAGNSGAEAAKYTPAGIENCITVSAIDKYDEKPIWANWGNMVDIVAPGVSVYSTYMDNGYETLSGTSMSCPFVVAASALLLSKNPSLNSDEVCGLLEDNGRVWTNDDQHIDSLYGKMALYIGTITEYNQDRTTPPEFTVESGRYSDSVTIEITCSDPNAEIYYTLDGSRASKTTGILYTGPIVIDKVTRVHACAYSGDKLKSLQVVADYYITVTDPEENFVIDTNGIITEYNGNNNYLTIPDTIDGIVVTGIGKRVFSASDLVMIKLPDTLTYVGEGGFQGCGDLKSVYCNNLKVVETRGFYLCREMDTIDLTQLEEVGEYAFSHCTSIPALYNEKLTTINKCSFNSLNNAIYIDLPNVTSVGLMGLWSLQNAEYVNLPKVKTLGKSALSHMYMLESIDLPELTEITGSMCFSSTRNLKEFNAPKLTNLPDNTFNYSTIENIELPNVVVLGEEIFYMSNIKSIKLDSVTEISTNAFGDCSDLETLYLPSATHISSGVFINNLYDDSNTVNIKIFAPNLVSLDSLPEQQGGATLYTSDKLESITVTPDYDYTIVAPLNSYSKQWTEENGCNFIPSDYRDSSLSSPVNVEDKGRSIRVTKTGLRFGFSWNEIPEIENLASDIEYGFIYHYNYDNTPYDSSQLTVENIGTDNIKQKTAYNLDHSTEGTTVFNLVFTDIPASNYDTNISVRAYVCIDGMYFYSNSRNGSYKEVSELVLKDSEIDQNTKNAVEKLLNKEA